MLISANEIETEENKLEDEKNSKRKSSKPKIIKFTKLKKPLIERLTVVEVFNNPLYEGLEHQEINKELHHFGPWITENQLNTHKHNYMPFDHQFPTITSSQDNNYQVYLNSTIRQDSNMASLTSIARENQEERVFPSLRQKESHQAMSTTVRNSPISFSPSIQYQSCQKLKKAPKFKHSGNKFHLSFKPVMVGSCVGKYEREVVERERKSSNVVFNYCLGEEDVNSQRRWNELRMERNNGNYLKLDKFSLIKKDIFKSTNAELFKEWREHRQHKVK